MAWTKGHVTLSFLLNGGGQARDAVYNSLADRAASKGYELPLSLCFHELLDYFARKQQRYIEIVRGICKRIARVAQAATEKLDLICQSQARGRDASFIDTPAPPTQDTSERINLTFVALPPIDTDAEDAQAQARIQIFWQRLLVIPILNVTSEVGATWLELFVLFHVRGGNAIVRKGASQAHLRHTHAKAYREFLRRSRALFAFADEATKPLLRAHLVRHNGN